MGLMDKHKGSSQDFGRIGAGTFPARIVQIFDMGRQENEYQGEVSNRPTLWITFELPTETITINGEDKPRWLSSEFTKSTNEKAKFYKVLNATNPEAETFKELLGQPLLVEVGTTSGGKDKFLSAMSLPKGMPVAELFNEAKFFDIAEPDMEILKSLPNFLQEKIKGSDDWGLTEPF